jgi:hypothetical protein
MFAVDDRIDLKIAWIVFAGLFANDQRPTTKDAFHG